MSLAVLKNVLFPRPPRSEGSIAVGYEHSQSNLVAKNDTSSLPPSHKDSEITWLSEGSATDLPSQRRDSSPPPPLPEKKLSTIQTVETGSDLEAQHYQAPVSKHWQFRLTTRMISDAIIGVSDGMTVPFALTAGLSSLGDTKLVVLGGLAELVAGAISMGLGGFIAAKSEAESYQATVVTTQKLIKESPSEASAMVHEVFKPYGLSDTAVNNVSTSLNGSQPKLLDFLMRFHHQIPQPDSSRPFVCAITIGLGYFFGGLVPLLPYFCVKRNEVLVALWWSIGVMTLALFAFGWTKTAVVVGWRGKLNIIAGLKGALQMTMIGGIAAAAAVGLVRAINHG